MKTTPLLSREEYVEQAYFFRILRERIADNFSTQEVLKGVSEEILSTTRLPYAIQFLSAELKHSGLLAAGFSRLAHYFTPFQTFVIRQAEEDGRRFSMAAALLVLEREAEYRATPPPPIGLFIFQFEVICRNRLGYDEGLIAMAGDPNYDVDWRDYLEMVRRQVGVVDFAELVYLRSEQYVHDQRRQDPGYEPPVPALVGEKEGKIAKANMRRDPLYFFGSLQRQLGYPEVPRPRPRDDSSNQLQMLQAKVQELESRLKLLESEARGHIDLSQFGKPDLFRDDD
jgi:hypothetical protein